MENRIGEIREQVKEKLKSVINGQVLSELKAKYLGKSGEITALLKGMRDIPAEERSAFGKRINDLKEEIAEFFAKKEEEIKQKELKARFEKEKVDITLSGRKQKLGGLHPLSLVKNEILDAFCGMGFEVFEGPEIDSDYYCFQALNIPKDHPARDMQDTFYFTENILLRPHTSPGQVRPMN